MNMHADNVFKKFACDTGKGYRSGILRFGVYFEIFLKIKWLFSYRNNYSIVTRMYALGAWGPAYVTRENF